MEDLKSELKLKRRVETHELEERKNQHINDLLYNHQEAFAQIKAYYNDITQDNLSLIRSLKDEISEMKTQERENTRRMQGLTVGNRQLAEPLKQKEAVRKELEHQLKSYAKDKLALKNLSSRSGTLESLLKEANADWRGLEEKFMTVEGERNELYEKFASAVREIKKKSEYKNVVRNFYEFVILHKFKFFSPCISRSTEVQAPKFQCLLFRLWRTNCNFLSQSSRHSKSGCRRSCRVRSLILLS